jgi:hypothetical protein
MENAMGWPQALRLPTRHRAELASLEIGIGLVNFATCSSRTDRAPPPARRWDQHGRAG